MSMPSSNVTQDYLKAVYAAGEWDEARASVSTLAARMGVSASTASETVRRLADEGLVHHERYGGITLTDAGRRAALAMVRRHRLIETLLVEHLGYGWDEVHDEAEVLEHAVSDLLVERVDVLLGRPVRDPHGDPIPGADGTVRLPAGRPLAEAPEGAGGAVVRISDAEPEVLRHLATVGVVLDAEVLVLERRAPVGTTVLQVRPAPATGAGPAGGGDAPPGEDEMVVELGDPAVAAVWIAR